MAGLAASWANSARPVLLRVTQVRLLADDLYGAAESDGKDGPLRVPLFEPAVVVSRPFVAGGVAKSDVQCHGLVQGYNAALNLRSKLLVAKSVFLGELFPELYVELLFHKLLGCLASFQIKAIYSR